MATSGGGTPKRKTTAKRGPTKAQALKALGLTQEDLEVLHELKEIRAHEHQEPQRLHEAEEVSEARAQAARENDQEQSAAAPQAVGQDHTPDNADPVWYMRNLRGVEIAFRLSRQESGRKRTTLKPRGQRGDMQKLEKEDLNDAELRTQVAYQLVEIIPEGEAMAAIEKQAINAQQPGYRPIESMLVNAKGETMVREGHEVVQADAIPFEQQGTVVARLSPQQNSDSTGDVPTRGRGIDWQQARQGLVQSTPVEKGIGTPGIISDGFAVSDNDQRAAMARDAVARQHLGEEVSGPSAAGMRGMKVTVEEPRKA
jgi:hypothetical protein